MDIPKRRATSRRRFLRDSAAILVAGGPAFELLSRNASVSVRVSPLKPAAQYRAEATQFETAFSEFASVATSIATSTDITRVVTRLDPSALAVDFQDSWMVSIAMEDPGLVAWVKKEIRDDATFKRFIDNVKRDPRSIYANAPIAALSARLEQLKLQKRALITKLIQEERRVAGLETSSADAAQKAAEAQECAKTWSIVTAILIVLVAVLVAVIAIVTSVFNVTAVEAAAVSLAAQYSGTGAELVRSAFITANQRYAQCVAAAKLLAPAKQAKALAACQATLLADKAVFIG